MSETHRPGGVGVSRMRSLSGFGVGLTAACLSAAANVAAERLSHDRRVALALDEAKGTRHDAYTVKPDHTFAVTASDGVTLHVEMDEPRGEPREPCAPGEQLPTIVFTHGYCLSSRCWVFQRRFLLDEGFRVVLWDQRGHGRSGKSTREMYTLEQLGSDLVTVVNEVVPDGPVVLVGHSMGAMAMMYVGLQHPDFLRGRVHGAAFIATSSGGLSSLTFGLGSLAGKAIWSLGPHLTNRLSGLQRQVDSTVRAGREVLNFFTDFGSFGSPVPMSIADLTSSMLFSTHMDVISAFIPQLNKHDLADALVVYQELETLVLNGTDDKVTPPSHSAHMVRILPGTEHVVVEQAGHVIMLEHPHVINTHVAELINRSRRAHRGLLAASSSRPTHRTRITDPLHFEPGDGSDGVRTGRWPEPRPREGVGE